MKILPDSIIKFRGYSGKIKIGIVTDMIVENDVPTMFVRNLLTDEEAQYNIERQIHNYGKIPLRKFKELYPEEFI